MLNIREAARSRAWRSEDDVCTPNVPITEIVLELEERNASSYPCSCPYPCAEEVCGSTGRRDPEGTATGTVRSESSTVRVPESERGEEAV